MKTYVDHELVTVRRVKRLLGFCRDLEPGTFPNALDVAFELSKRHTDGPSVGLAALLLEAGLVGDLPEGQRVSKARTGRDIAEWLETFQWRPSRSAAARQWRPPVTRRGGGP